MAQRLLRRALSRGWVGWVAQWQHAVRRRESLRWSLSHFANRDLSAGWNSWAARAAERVATVRLRRMGLSHRVGSQLAKAFSSWRESMAVSASAGRQRDSVSRALRHLMHRELSRGWVGWHARWREAVRRRESARRGLSHQVTRELPLDSAQRAAPLAQPTHPPKFAARLLPPPE